MSKYDPLWAFVQQAGSPSLRLSFAEIAQIAGVPLDHSFLQHKKELATYGYRVAKISMKQQTVLFQRLD